MYINFTLIKEKGYSPAFFILMQMCAQNDSGVMEEVISDYLTGDSSLIETYITKEHGILALVKGTKKQTIFNKVRLSKKGKNLLRLFQTYEVEDQDIRMYDWLKKTYLNMGKEVGSLQKGLGLCAWFRRESGISKNNLAKLCKHFIEDEERMQYSLVLQFMFWKPENRFQTTPSLKDSKLWLHYEKHQEHFESIFEQQ